MSNRSDKYTIETKKVVQYTDFLTNLDKNPLTGFLAKVKNEDAVKQSVRNLILTERTERFMQPQIGSKIHTLLFEPLDQHSADLLRTTIRETINTNEPRAVLNDVTVEPREDLNVYFVSVYFGIRNVPEESFNLSLILRRVR